MKMRTLLQALVCLAVAAFQILGANIDGKWTWEMEGRDGQKRTQTATLKAEGDKLTGTMSGRQGETPIENGKINGDDISFTRTMNFGGESRKMTYTGKLVGDELKLTMKMDGGDMPPREFVAKRAQ
jgi:hypothetical protein